jgi:tRNA pseudouridine38-40 synthase
MSLDKTRYKLIVSYDGTDFCGWQKQKAHKHASLKPSIQETLEDCLTKIFNEKIDVSASGRTDAGVHALAQVAHFESSNRAPQDLCWATRSGLPNSVVVKKAWIAPADFHSTLSATHKTYRYWIWNSERPTALLNRYSDWLRGPLDLEHLNKQAQFLIAKQDYKSFQSVGTEVVSTVREIYQAGWRRRNKDLVEFTITGSGFLKQMVRNIVGTQLWLLKNAQAPEMLQEIIDSKDRKKAGPAAPPQGLFLAKVYYPAELDKRCRQI